MKDAIILDFTLNGVILILLLSMPAIIVATAVGLVVSLFQALTQIQEQTLGHAVKLISVIVVMLFTTNWVVAELYKYSNIIFTSFQYYVR